MYDYISRLPHSEESSGVNRVEEGQGIITLGCIFMYLYLELYI
jgi:hypothetical protein